MYKTEELERISEILENMAAGSKAAAISFEKLSENTPNHFRFEKHRKCNNAKRPKPRKKKRKC